MTERKNKDGRLSGIDEASIAGITGLADKDKDGKASFGELYKMFRENKLSRAESLYNCLFITCAAKRAKSGKLAAEKKSKDLFRHPKGWFASSSAESLSGTFWKMLMGILLALPTAVFSMSKLPSFFSKKISDASETADNSSVIMGNLFVKAAIFCVVAASVVFCAGHMVYSSTLSPVLELTVDGKKIGYIRSTEVYESAVYGAESHLSSILGVGYKIPDGTSSYRLVNVRDPEYVSEETVKKALTATADRHITTAYGLFVDGTLVAANSSQAVMDKILSDTEAIYNELYSSVIPDSNIVFSGRVFVAETTVPKSMLSGNDEIREKLGLDALSNFSSLILKNDKPRSKKQQQAAVDEVVNLSPVLEGITSMDISAHLPGENLYYTEQVSSDKTAVDADTGDEAVSELPGEELISIAKTTEKKTVREIISCDEEFIYDEEMIAGRKIVISAGVDGIRSATYEISYIGEKEIEKKLVASEIIKEPVKKVIKVGTRPITDEELMTRITGTFIYPYNGQITSTFSGRNLFGAYEFHGALDICGPAGSTIVASDGGTVVYSDWLGTYGLCVIIDHGDGIETLYAHLRATAVSEGDRVGQGWKIGEMGRTGRATGDHVHFEVRLNGVKQNPADYLEQ